MLALATAESAIIFYVHLDLKSIRLYQEAWQLPEGRQRQRQLCEGLGSNFKNLEAHLGAALTLPLFYRWTEKTIELTKKIALAGSTIQYNENQMQRS
jgi:hypothetical protein